jgi:hypothetical protein
VQKRSIDARMLSAVLIHENGFGASLWRLMKAVIAASRAATLRWIPRLTDQLGLVPPVDGPAAELLAPDDMDIEIVRHCGLDAIKKTAELNYRWR